MYIVGICALISCSEYPLREKCPNTEYFPVFILKTEIYSVNLRIQFEYRKIRTRKTPYLDTFHEVIYPQIILFIFTSIPFPILWTPQREKRSVKNQTAKLSFAELPALCQNCSSGRIFAGEKWLSFSKESFVFPNEVWVMAQTIIVRHLLNSL